MTSQKVAQAGIGRREATKQSPIISLLPRGDCFLRIKSEVAMAVFQTFDETNNRTLLQAGKDGK